MDSYLDTLTKQRDALLARTPLTPAQRKAVQESYGQASTFDEFASALEPLNLSEKMKSELTNNWSMLSDALEQGVAMDPMPTPESPKAWYTSPRGAAEAAGYALGGLAGGLKSMITTPLDIGWKAATEGTADYLSQFIPSEDTSVTGMLARGMEVNPLVGIPAAAMRKVAVPMVEGAIAQTKEGFKEWRESPAVAKKREALAQGASLPSAVAQGMMAMDPESLRAFARTIPVVGPQAEKIGSGLASSSPQEFGEAVGETAAMFAPGVSRFMPRTTAAVRQFAAGRAKAAGELVSGTPAESAAKMLTGKMSVPEVITKALGPRSKMKGTVGDRFVKNQQAMERALSNSKAGMDELGIDVNKKFSDPITNAEINPGDPGAAVRAVQLGAKTRMRTLWNAVEKAREGSGRRLGIMSDSIADYMERNIPSDLLKQASSPTPPVGVPERLAAIRARIEKYRNGQFFDASEIDSNITKNNDTLDDYFRQGKAGADVSNQEAVVSLEQNALKDALVRTFESKEASDQLRFLMRQYGEVQEFQERLAKRYQDIAPKDPMSFGAFITALSAGRTGARALMRSATEPVQSLGYGLESMLSYGLPTAMREGASSDSLLRMALQRTKTAPATIRMPNMPRLTPKEAATYQRAIADVSVAERTGQSLPQVGGVETGLPLDPALRQQLQDNPLFVRPPSQPLMLPEPSFTEYERLAKTAKTAKDRAMYRKMADQMKQEYTRYGTIQTGAGPKDWGMMPPEPMAPQTWSQAETLYGIPTRLPTGESVVIIGRNPETGLTRFRYLVPGRENEIGEAYLDLPMPAPRESLVSPIILPKKR